MNAPGMELDQRIGTETIQQISAVHEATMVPDMTAVMIGAGGIERLTKCHHGSVMTKQSEDGESTSVTNALAKAHIDRERAVRIPIRAEALSIGIGMILERATL